MRTLVLWDIDHTLVDPGGLSSEIYAGVFQRLIGRPPEMIAPMAGRTDRAITAETLRHHGIDPVPDLLESFAEALAEAFAARQDDVAVRGRVLPGALAALKALAARPGVVQSALTGNMKQIAVCKLTAFGLIDYFDLEAGAYGMDDAERPPLVKLAQKRAADRYGEPFTAANTVLVGDTLHDVRAAHEGGARIVAVATGATPAAALHHAGAETVLPDLTDLDQTTQSILTP